MQHLLQEYDALLAAHSPERVWSELSAAMLDAGLGQRGAPFTRALRPRLLSRSLGEAILQKISTLARAATRLCEQALASDELLDLIGLSEEERALARAPAPPGLGLTRIDGFLDGERFRVVEWNGGCPAGGGYLDRAAPVFQRLAPFAAFARRREVSYLPTAPQVLENLLARYRAAGGTKPKPAIAVVDFAGLSTADEHEIFRDLFARSGHPAEILPPEALELKGGALSGPSGPIDIVYRRLVTRDYLPKRKELPAVAEAALQGAAVFVDPFRTEVIHKKSFLAVLSDPRYGALITGEERAVISELIPWTRRARAERTTDPAGREVDLPDFARRERERLVLKPTDGYGGKGILLGWEVSAALWERVLDEALSGRMYVLQERVATPRARYPVFVDGRVEEQELLEDLCPYLSEDRASGFLCRATSLSLGNVSAGANPLPVFLVA